MEIKDYPELIDKTYDWITQRIWDMTTEPRTAGIHLTELIYCLTASYWNRIMPIPYERQQALTMALGIGLERVIVPEEHRAKPGTCEGVDYSPDFWYTDTLPAELKTTRMGSRKTHEREFPESWMQQIQGYCYAEKKTEYGLSVVHLMGNYKPPFPEILAVKFTFTQKELQDNWDFLTWRKSVYINSFAEQKPPEPRKWAKTWECGTETKPMCRYATSLIHCNLWKAK